METYKKNISPRYRFVFGFTQFLDHVLGRKLGFRITKRLRKRLYDGLYTKVKKGQKGRVLEIDRVVNISERDFRKNYLRKNIPVVLEGAAKEWACVKDWGIDYFIEKHGSDEILVVGEIELLKDGSIKRNNYETNLAKELTEIKNGGSNYYKFYPLIERHPEHLDDIETNFFKRRMNRFSSFLLYQVFIGAKGTITNLHNASASNFFTQIEGEKEWYLYPVYYSSVIDPSPTDGLSRGAPVRTQKGPFDPFNPDYDYPYHLYEYVDCYRVVLKPGDVLFNPPYWWHAVRNNSTSIGMGFRWYSPSAIFRSSGLYATLDLFSSFWIKIGSAKKDINKVHKKNLN